MKKKLIIPISLISIVALVAVFYVSYGFVAARITNNEFAKKQTFINQKLEIEYSDGSEELISKNTSFIPGSTITKTFTIKNNGNVKLNFKINLKDVINEFSRKNDITYELYLEDELIATNKFPNFNSTIAYNQTINVNRINNYKLKIIYNSSEENQIIDQGKIISGKIDFEEQKDTITNIRILGNSIQNGIPSLENPVEIESVGDKIETLEDNVSEHINLFDNKKLLVKDNSQEKWEITETGIKQTKLDLSGYILKTIYDITDLVKPNTTYYFHNEFERNFICTYNECNSLAGAFLIYIDGKCVSTIFIGERDQIVVMPSEFEKVEIKTHTVPNSSVIKNFNEDIDYYFEWKNTYISTVKYNNLDINKYEIPIKISGNNIANFSIVSNQNLVNTKQLSYNSFRVKKLNDTSIAYGQIETYLELGKTYTLYTKINSEITGAYVHAWKDYDGNEVYKSNIPEYYTFTATQEKFILGLYPSIEKGTDGLETDFTFMLVEGTYNSKNYPEYETYFEPIYYNIILDEPLRKVGDCNNYICMDYIDLMSKKVVRNIRYWEFDGSESWGKYNYNNTYNGFMTSGSLDGNHSRTVGLSNFTKQVGNFYSGVYIWVGVGSDNLYLLGTGHYDESLSDYGLSNFKKFLNDNHLKVQYLAKKVETKDIDVSFIANIPPGANISVLTTVPSVVEIK